MTKTMPARRPQFKPKLGQHFLNDDAAAQRIVEALSPQGGALEIGPGKGVLTALLARRFPWLIAIELDKVLAAQLRMQFALASNVEIIEGDILKMDLGKLFAPKPGLSRPGLALLPEPVQVVGNLPYYITSDILLRLFEFRQYFSTIVVMVQKEVADRLAAPHGGSEYGLLSATAQLYCKVEKLFTIPPTSFSPPPKVYSTVVRMTLADRLAKLQVPEPQFIAFLKLCFGLKRKTLWNNLKPHYAAEVLKAAFSQARVKPAVRAEVLTLEQMAALFRVLQGAA